MTFKEAKQCRQSIGRSGFYATALATTQPGPRMAETRPATEAEENVIILTLNYQNNAH